MDAALPDNVAQEAYDDFQARVNQVLANTELHRKQVTELENKFAQSKSPVDAEAVLLEMEGPMTALESKFRQGIELINGAAGSVYRR